MGRQTKSAGGGVVMPSPPEKYNQTDQAEVRRIIESMSRARWDAMTDTPTPIQAFAQVEGAADKIAYFTSASEMALAALTPYARTLIAAANAGAARTVLGLGALAVRDDVTEVYITLADNTTDNVSTTKHGFAPKAPNDVTKFLDGTGAYSTPSTAFPGALPTFPSISNLEGRFSAEPTVSTLTLNTDGRVAQVNDASGNWGSNLTAATTARPRWMPRAMHGLRPGMVFDGAAAKLVAGGTKAISQPLTVVAVFQNWKLGAANANVYRDSAGGPVLFINSSTDWAIFAGTVLASTALMNQNVQQLPDGMVGAPAISVGVYDNTSSIISNNGVEVTGTAGTNAIGGTMYVGGDSTTSFAHIVLYELLFFSKALSAPERAQINTYYATACGITL